VPNPIWWVEDLAHYCRGRQPDCVVIAQNAADLAEDADYRQAIDAIAQEQVWFDGAADNDPPGDCPLPATAADVDTPAYECELRAIDEGCYRTYIDYPASTLHVSSEVYITALRAAQRHGMLIFSVDYALACANVARVYDTARALGFVPFSSERALSIYRDPLALCSTHLPIMLR
jgi:endo-alpha-1,4-polygalactosaminidase (GH114 family)